MSNVTLTADTEIWIRAAFSSSSDNEAYIFVGKKYVLINYADAAKGTIIRGPEPIDVGFPSLAHTLFAETGINCAFRARDFGDGNEAFIFCGSLCALWRFAPNLKHKKVEEIVKGPITIGQMFPGLKGKEFEKGIDAAFESSKKDEAYLFKDDQYARINYNTGQVLYILPIAQGFGCLASTDFKDGIGAAFASFTTKNNDVYLFQENSYARMVLTPDKSDDKITVGPKKILPTWAALDGIVPLNDHGPDDTRPSPFKNQGPDTLPFAPQATLSEL